VDKDTECKELMMEKEDIESKMSQVDQRYLDV
jgi:hypothetical protein